MNKEQAIEVFEWWKESNEDVLNDELYDDEQEKKDREKLAQALNIIADILDQNIHTIRVEREFDIFELDKGTDYLLTKMTEDFVREFVKANVLEMIASETRDIHKTKAIFEVKVVEPYERKENK